MTPLRQAGVPWWPLAALTVAGVVVVLGAAAALFSGGRLQAVGEDINDGVNNGLLAGLGLQEAHVHVQGASAASTPAILHAANVQEGDGVLGVDLKAVRRRVERVGWVDDAKVIRLIRDSVGEIIDLGRAVRTASAASLTRPRARRNCARATCAGPLSGFDCTARSITGMTWSGCLSCRCRRSAHRTSALTRCGSARTAFWYQVAASSNFPTACWQYP